MAIAGFIDAIGYLTLRQIYVANMSGNTVAVAIHLSKREWTEAWAHGCPILAFVPGLIAGDAIVELCKRSRVRGILMPAMLIESAGLALFVLFADRSISPRGVIGAYDGANYALLVGLLAFSMGLQNGALRRIGALKDVHTYVTGMLLATAHGCTNYLLWLGRRLRKARWNRVGAILRYSPHHRSLRAATLAAMLWTLYLIGAIIGAALRMRFGVHLLLAPISLLLLMAVVDVIKPIQNRPRAPARG